ncbi:MAG TPA: hypothetical protein VF550_20860, partial [Polyangia bacterium]
MEDEKTFGAVVSQQLRRMARRAIKRPYMTGALTLGVAAALFALQARRPSIYSAEVGLLISEGVFADDGRPRPRGELLSFINRAVFANPRLEGLVDKHNLVKALKAPSKEFALDRMRSSIDVHIWHDYFENQRGSEDPPRTVRVTVGFSAPNPTLALAVARDLGALVAETQTDRMIQAANAHANARRILAGSAASRAVGLREEFERTKRMALEQPGGQAYVSLERLRLAVKSADAASMAAAADLVDAELQARATRSVGHLVQVVDPGAPIWGMVSRRERLLRQGILSLLAGLC